MSQETLLNTILSNGSHTTGWIQCQPQFVYPGIDPFELLKGGDAQCDVTEIMVEINLYFSGQKASKFPIYIDCMYMLFPLNDQYRYKKN